MTLGEALDLLGESTRLLRQASREIDRLDRAEMMHERAGEYTGLARKDVELSRDLTRQWMENVQAQERAAEAGLLDVA